jgi:hypothetical protein
MNWALKSGVSWMILCALATTSAAEVLPESIRTCKREPDDARRLQCYDREVAKFPTPEQAFGLSPSAAQRQSSSPVQKKPEPDSQPKSLTTKVVALRERPNAGFVVTFDNGQVWVQYEDESTRGVHVGDLVTIKPGVLGSFWLVSPSGWATKIHRLK